MHHAVDDKELQEKVLDELRGEPALDPADIGVTVERGVVALHGHVPSASRQAMAEEIVRRTPGVRAVVDDLDVRPTGIPAEGDIRLALDALEAIGRRCAAAGGGISVVVHDGRVRLTGTVVSPQEREAAEAAVADVVLGWGAVENEIVVARPE